MSASDRQVPNRVSGDDIVAIREAAKSSKGVMEAARASLVKPKETARAGAREFLLSFGC